MALDSGLTVDAAQPLNLTHPLLRDVAGFWVPTESRAGGSKLYDLSGHGRHAEIIGDTTRWKNSEKYGPLLNFDDTTDDRVEIPPFDWSPPSTLTFVMRSPNNKGGYFQYVFSHNSYGRENSFNIYMDEESKSDGELKIVTDTSGPPIGEQYLGTGFHTITAIFKEGKIGAVIDGETKFTSANFGTDFGADDGNPLIFGLRSDFNDNRRFIGDVYSPIIHNRSLSIREAKELHKEIDSGFPSLLNRRTGSDLYVLDGTGSGTGTTYTVSGTVTDSGGTAIQGATVSLENVTGAAQTTDTTDASGTYSISVALEDSDLPDTWDVTVDASGFTAQTKQVSASTSSTSYTKDFSLSSAAISGSASITDGGEIVSATGQTEVSGTLSVTDGSETLTINGATKVSGTASITEGVETFLASGTADVQGAVALTDSGEIITASGTVITTGSVSITDSGEIISAVSSLQDITGTAQITDAAEEVSATGEVKIAGTATLKDGTEEVVIIGESDITGTVSFADLAAEIAATGSVEVQGSLALTDAGESITARERVPARLATVDVTLEDIIIVHAQLTD